MSASRAGPAFNWIRAEFATGTDFVSDAPHDVADAIERAMPEAAGAGEPGCEFGSCRLVSRELRCVYLRYATATAGAIYLHAVAWDATGGDPATAGIERIFGIRYGEPPVERVRELVRRLARLPVAQATLPLTDLFVEAGDVAALTPTPRRTAKRATPRPARAGGTTLPWWIAAAATAVASFFVGRMVAEGFLSTGASTPAPVEELDIERRFARLESDRGAADVSLRIQLQHERRLHEEALATRDREIAQLELQLEASDAMVAALRSSAVTRIAKREETPRRTPEATPAPVQAAPEDDASVAQLEDLQSPPLAVAAVLPAVSSPPPGLPGLPDLPGLRGLPPVATRTAVVLADLLWVREQPGREHRKLTRLTRGTRVELEGPTREGWSRISAPARGWVAIEYLEVQAAAPSAESEMGDESDESVAAVVAE